MLCRFTQLLESLAGLSVMDNINSALFCEMLQLVVICTI